MHIIKWIPKDSKSNKIRKKLGFSSVKAVICCGIFLAAAAFKLLAPQTTQALRTAVFGEIEREPDYIAAISTLGKSISDSEKLTDAFDSMYTAVFGSDTPEAIEVSGGTVNLSAHVQAPGENAVATLQRQAEFLHGEFEKLHPAATETPAETEALTEPTPATEEENSDAAAASENTPQEAAAPTPATVQYDYPDMAPPEGASLDYTDLGIDNYVLPVSGSVSSNYGYRQHPISGEFTFHSGLDIAGNEGDDVLCFADGYVRAAGEHQNLGKYLIITHSNGVETIYGHLSDWYVSEGSNVTAGQVIAAVGQTGAATGPHLHLEVYKDGIKVNPRYYFDI